MSLELCERLLNSIRNITKQLDSYSRKFLKENGLSTTQMLAIKIIKQNGAVSLSFLAQQLNLSLSSTSLMIDRLINRNLVCKRKSENDRRQAVILLTEEAEKKYKQPLANLAENFFVQFDSLEKWEKNMLIAVVERINLLISDSQE